MSSRRRLAILAFFALLLLAFATMRKTDVYNLPWWSLEGGGGGGGCYQARSGYALCGAIGQADAGSGSGGGFQVQSGFWSGPRLSSHPLYLPLVRK